MHCLLRNKSRIDFNEYKVENIETMLIIHDARLPEEAIINLQKYGDCIPFLTHNITHQSIAGHPDIFFCPVDEEIIVASNIPEKYIDILVRKGLRIKKGQGFIGREKQNSTCYNAVITDQFIIHNRKYTDLSILEHTNQRRFIHVNQAYTRCSLLALKENHFLTSDKGIEKVLQKEGLDVCYVMPKEISLPGVEYGLIGGCMGIYKNKVFITGNLKMYSKGEKVHSFLSDLGYEIIELYTGRLYDGGSLFFIDL